MGQEMEQSGRLLQANISTDQKLVLSKPSAVEKAADGRAEMMEKVKDAPDVTNQQDKRCGQHVKKKKKEKDGNKRTKDIENE